MIGPPMPRSLAILAARTASMMMPARVGGVPDLELVLEVQRDVTEGATLEADVGPLAVVEPRRRSRTGRCGRCGRRPCRQRPVRLEVTAWVLEIFLDSRRSRSSMFLKSMLPPTLSW